MTDPKRAHAMTRFLTSALLCPVRTLASLLRAVAPLDSFAPSIHLSCRSAPPSVSPGRCRACTRGVSVFAFGSPQVYKRAQQQPDHGQVHPDPMARAHSHPHLAGAGLSPFARSAAQPARGGTPPAPLPVPCSPSGIPYLPPIPKSQPGDLHALTGQHQTEQERAREAAAASSAEAAFAPLFEGDGLVRTLIERFLVPTREELDEWQSDPVALLASREPTVSAGGEADSPRPCAELLLTCMLLRECSAVSAAVLRVAEEARAQLKQPASSAEEAAARVLVCDGAYRAIGVLAGEMPKESVSFPSWFNGEIRPMLEAHAALAAGGLAAPGSPAWVAALPERLLCARGLWLIGRFCDDVAEDPEALELVVPVVLQHLARPTSAQSLPRARPPSLTLLLA